MNAVLIELNVAGVDREQGLDALRKGLVPAICAMPGFVSGTWLTGNHDDPALSLTVWDTDAQAQAFADRFGVGVTTQVGAAVERCEVREVAATA